VFRVSWCEREVKFFHFWKKFTELVEKQPHSLKQYSTLSHPTIHTRLSNLRDNNRLRDIKEDRDQTAEEALGDKRTADRISAPPYYIQARYQVTAKSRRNLPRYSFTTRLALLSSCNTDAQRCQIISQDATNRSIDSMPARSREVIAKKGQRTRY